MGFFGRGGKVTEVEARPSGGDGLDTHALAPSEGEAAASVAVAAAAALLRQASSVADKAAAAAKAGARASAAAASTVAASGIDAARAKLAALSLAPALREWLAQTSLSPHAPALAALGVAQLQDVRVVSEADLVQAGMKPVELARWKAAVAALPAPAPGGAAVATHTVTPPAPPAPPGETPHVRVRALVMGCDAYVAPLPRLANAVHDAVGVAAALRALPGAEVTLLPNPSRAEMEAALRALRNPALPPGPPSERILGLVFFAGHGLQVHGRNHLVPCDFAAPPAHPQLEVMLKDTAAACVSLDAATEALEDAGVFVRAVLLDCCRNVPDFLPGATRSLGGGGGAGGGSRGMCVTTPAPRVKDDEGGMFVAFATAPGEVAQDASSRVPGHSPFTAALIASLKTPRRLNDLQMFLRDEVKSDTGGAQVPFVTASFSTEAGSLVLGGA
jgi:hypothetical protein